jgi:hypothetical protein
MIHVRTFFGFGMGKSQAAKFIGGHVAVSGTNVRTIA